MSEVGSDRRCGGKWVQRGQQGPDCAGPGYVFMLPAPDPGGPSHTARGGVDVLKTMDRTELESQDNTA